MLAFLPLPQAMSPPEGKSDLMSVLQNTTPLNPYKLIAAAALLFKNLLEVTK